MDIDRINTAVEFLKDGQSFRVANIRLGVNDDSDIYITGWTRSLQIEDLTKRQALEELGEIKGLFNEMLEIPQKLKVFVKDKTVKYNLAYNYGMGAVGICFEKNGIIKWEMELK